jgi:hypothetical protein
MVAAGRCHWRGWIRDQQEDARAMIPLLLALLLIVVLFGAGSALHLLYWVAVIALVLWLLGFVMHGSGRWYRW